MRIIVGITGASGARYGIRLLEVLRAYKEVESHLIITEAGKRTILLETDYPIGKVEALAHYVYDNQDLAAPLTSGSFSTAGMIIVPCSVKTLSGLANSFNSNLLIRAGDVTLKERRKLVVVFRETPLHLGHLRLLVRLAETGAIILPPFPAFYHHPRTISDLIDHTVGKILDQFGLEHQLFKRWEGAGS
jgi:4-hydroxy-3-polyprenylbenzoate decarboxylase